MATNLLKRQKAAFWGTVGVLLAGVFLVFTSIAMRNPAPTAEAEWTQTTATSVEKVTTLLESIVNWPRFCPSVRQARLITYEGQPLLQSDQRVQEGAVIEFWIDPELASKKKTDEEIVLEIIRPVTDTPVHKFRFIVENYAPGGIMRLRMLLDPSGAINRLYKDLVWEIDMATPGQIRLKVMATPTAWNSKIFASLLAGPTLRPLAFLNLQKLASIQNPLGVNSVPQWRR